MKEVFFQQILPLSLSAMCVIGSLYLLYKQRKEEKTKNTN